MITTIPIDLPFDFKWLQFTVKLCHDHQQGKRVIKSFLGGEEEKRKCQISYPVYMNSANEKNNKIYSDIKIGRNLYLLNDIKNNNNI